MIVSRVNGRGFALAALIIFMTALTILLAAAVPTYQLQVRRELEEELIFRGEEYIRAIQKYQRQFGIFPPSIDALLETNGIRYLRRAYVNPITGEAFRLLTVNPDGTINGSVSLSTLGTIPSLFQGETPSFFPTRGSLRPDAQTGETSGLPSAGAPQERGLPNTFLPPGQGDLQPLGGTGFQGGGFGAGVPDAGETPEASRPGEAGESQANSAFSSGGVVGVAPADGEQSLKVYNGREVYSEWEFIAIPGYGTVLPTAVPPPSGGVGQSDPFSTASPAVFNQSGGRPQ